MVAESHPAAGDAEQAISPALRRGLQQCYDRATRLMQEEKYDFEYAFTMFRECVTKDPGNLVYLDAFFENLRRKYKNNKRGSLLSFGGKGPFKKALARHDWGQVLKLGPDILKANPWDVATLRGMAEACAASGYTEAELRYLRTALEPKPNDAAVNRHCAATLTRLGQYDQAIACWHRVDEAKKGGDVEAQKMISELQIEKTQQRLGRGKEDGQAGVKRQAGAPREEEPPPVEPPRREIPLTARQQLEQAIVINPSDLESYFALAQLHADEHRLGEAVHVLHKALAATGNDVQVQERVEDFEILRKRHQLAIAEQRAESQPSDESQQLVGDLRHDLNRYELDVFHRRAQRYPAELELRFQLGLRLKRVENLREAIKCFEAAAELPQRRAGSSLEMGECLQRHKEYGKALECYLRAVEQAEEAEQMELRKLALYRAGVLAAGLKNVETAEQQLSRLCEIDADYKDAATRLDKVRKMSHKK